LDGLIRLGAGRDRKKQQKENEHHGSPLTFAPSHDMA